MRFWPIALLIWIMAMTAYLAREITYDARITAAASCFHQ